MKGLDAKDVGKRGNLGESQHFDDDALLQEKDSLFDMKTRDVNKTTRAQFENELNQDAKNLDKENFASKESILSFHNVTKMTTEEKQIEMHRRRIKRNYTLASSEEQAALKNKYLVASLRDKMPVVKRTNEKDLTKPFDDAPFRNIVDEVVSQQHNKDRQVSLTSKPVYYTQLSEQRRVPLHKVDATGQTTKCKSYLQFMENFIE